ncbi:MAG: bifunctional serine/threonine-protein kinase/formylglycine-generating enzyme family protein [Lysobacteraceae bacterium]
MTAGGDETLAWPHVEGYRIEAVIGRGGMATVYRARQVSLDRTVAIKLMARRDDDDASAERFAHEARIIAGLEHPGIVGIHDVGRLPDGRLFYAMPWLPGGDLAGRELRGDQRAILGILRVLLGALGHAHAHGVVHRDVKPENVLFDANGQPRLADFGIALGGRRPASRITREGMALGSGGYMAPEQARGEALDGRADLYGVGVLAYEMLTGELPFHAEDELAQALMHAQDPVPRLPAALAHWQGWIDRAMAKHPSQRYPDAQAMLRALDRVEQGIGQSGGAARRRIGWRWLLGALVLLALALLVWRSWQAAEPVAGEAAVVAPVAPVDEVGALLATAARQLQAGALVTPAGGNAAETYIEALRRQPGRADAMNGLRRVFAGLAQQARQAVEVDDDDLLAERIAQAELLAEGLGALGDEGRLRVREAAQQALDVAIAQAIAAADSARSEQLLARYALHGLDAATAQGLLRRVPAATPAAPPRAAGVPGGRLVSVGEYRRFVEATGRADSRCRARLSPLQLIEERTWRDPGFPQGEESPVVCVSHADAQDYARWLSAQGGGRWRLPSLAEQRQVSGSRDVDEWTDDCARSGTQGCVRRQVFTRAGQDGSRDPARGYDEVGIRLVRGR